MRKYAYLKEPLELDGESIYKIMLYKAGVGCYLFEYDSPAAFQCSRDLFYPNLVDVYDNWDDLIDERGWIDIGDPLPGCQHDAFIPLRVKGRDKGKPEWGKYETLKDGVWVDFDPESDTQE